MGPPCFPAPENDSAGEPVSTKRDPKDDLDTGCRGHALPVVMCPGKPSHQQDDEADNSDTKVECSEQEDVPLVVELRDGDPGVMVKR